WAVGVSDLLAQMYGAEVFEEGEDVDPDANRNLGAEGQRAAIEKLKQKLQVMQESLQDSQYKTIFSGLVTMEGRLARRINLADAILNSLSSDIEGARQAQVDAQLGDVSGAVENVKSYL